MSPQDSSVNQATGPPGSPYPENSAGPAAHPEDGFWVFRLRIRAPTLLPGARCLAGPWPP